MELIRIDEDTVKIVDEVETTVSISALETRLAAMQASNEQARLIDDYWATAPDFIKPYIQRFPIQDTTELEELIATYQAL